MASLDAYLDDCAARPFDWNGNDCTVGFVGRWILARTGIDALAEYRGRFSTAIGAYRLLKREGGLVAVYDRHLGPRTTRPRRGDVGVVGAITDCAHGHVSAICLGDDAWAALGSSGVVIGPAEVAAAWSLKHG